MCANVAAGVTAPSGQCAANPPCGNTGACNGNGGCQQGAATLVCGAAVSCSVSTYQPVSHCNGNGACAQVATAELQPVACGESSCLTGCSNDNQCAAGSFCSAGNCVGKRADGRALHERRPVRNRQLHRRVLLRFDVVPVVPELRRQRQRGDVRQPAGGQHRSDGHVR